MGFWEQFPYSNFHQLNLDWLLKTTRNAEVQSLQAVETSKECVEKLELNLNNLDELVREEVAKIDVEGIVENVVTDNLLTYTNVLSLGVVANDVSYAVSNSRIINENLANKTVLYFPEGVFYFNDTLRVVNGSGIVGELSGKTILQYTGSESAIEVRLDFSEATPTVVDNYYKVKDLTIAGSGSGIGLDIVNAFYKYTCGSDLSQYIVRKGDSYALEGRTSPVENVRITYFSIGLNTGILLATLYFNNLFIDTCTGRGVNNLASDSFYNNIYVTYCSTGFYENSESNKFSNLKLFFNGRSRTGGVVENGRGLICEYSRHESFSNIEIQENFANGAYIANVSDSFFTNITVDSNGFRSENNKVGVEINSCTGCYFNIIALNKNEIKTQRLGIYQANNKKCCTFYRESEQLAPIADDKNQYKQIVLGYKMETTIDTSAYMPLRVVYDNNSFTISGAAIVNGVNGEALFTLPFDSGTMDQFIQAYSVDNSAPIWLDVIGNTIKLAEDCNAQTIVINVTLPIN